MAGSLNKVQLLGNLGRDPEIRHTQDGRKVATFSVATSETWKDKVTGERQDRTEWHRVVVFNERLVDVIERYVKKGSKLYVEGQLQTRKWTDNQGMERYTTEIVLQRFRGELMLLDSRSGGGEGFASGLPDESSSSMSGGMDDLQPAPGPAAQSAKDLDDEIPF